MQLVKTVAAREYASSPGWLLARSTLESARVRFSCTHMAHTFAHIKLNLLLIELKVLWQNKVGAVWRTYTHSYGAREQTILRGNVCPNACRMRRVHVGACAPSSAINLLHNIIRANTNRTVSVAGKTQPESAWRLEMLIIKRHTRYVCVWCCVLGICIKF